MIELYVLECEDPVPGSRRLLGRGLAGRNLPEETPLCHDQRGRPFLRQGPEVSLSHTRGAAAAALGDSPLGVDLERHRPVREGVPERVMSPEEYAWFREGGCRREDFYTLWTLKESYYKYLGTGLPGFPNETVFRREGDRWRLDGTDLQFLVWEKNLLSVALCSEGQEVRVMWFSES